MQHFLLVTKIEIIGMLLNTFHKYITKESDALHNHSALLTMI